MLCRKRRLCFNRAMPRPRYNDIPPPGAYKARQAVDLEVLTETELGYRALVDGRYTGLLYRSELPAPLREGQQLRGWIKAVRPDGRLDLSITQLDDESRSELEDMIMAYLRRHGGKADVSDASPPARIQQLFGCSKASFKRAIGRLYKQRLIVIGEGMITLP